MSNIKLKKINKKKLLRRTLKSLLESFKTSLFIYLGIILFNLFKGVALSFEVNLLLFLAILSIFFVITFIFQEDNQKRKNNVKRANKSNKSLGKNNSKKIS